MIRRTTRETEMLLQARWRLGLSQHQVASLVGLADRQYQRYEYGEMAIHCINLRAGLALCAVLEALESYEVCAYYRRWHCG